MSCQVFGRKTRKTHHDVSTSLAPVVLKKKNARRFLLLPIFVARGDFENVTEPYQNVRENHLKKGH